MEIFKEGLKMKADIHTRIEYSILVERVSLPEVIPNILCSIPFFGTILYPNYAFVVCLLTCLLFSKDRDYKFISHSTRLY